MTTIDLTIFRNEKPIWVSVDIISFHRGSKDPIQNDYTDDPPVVECEEYGMTKDGEQIPLTISEINEAESMALNR